ncbi:unnamed protein product, partial [Choristocarpus tenellus]
MADNGVWSFTADEKPSRKRSRFNLLALEHGEYYFQDYSAYYYPPSTLPNSAGLGPSSYASGGARRPRHQGRLKLCSRGLLFEPSDRLLPLVKYPFRHMETPMEPVAAVVGGRTGGNGSASIGLAKAMATPVSAASEWFGQRARLRAAAQQRGVDWRGHGQGIGQLAGTGMEGS